jgi:DNA helicase-2/ATP-dependent DNA helicase PcrA
MAWDDGLTGEQQRAASHVGQHARLLAGPGTGKTLVLTRRIVYLVRDAGVMPGRIIALTFTRAAIAELKRRVRLELGEDASQVIIFTLHSYALRAVLREAGGRLPQPIRIADDYEERWIIEEDLKRILGLARVTQARDLLAQLSADWEQLTADEPEHERRFPNPAFLGAWREHRTVFGYVLRSELVYQLKHALEEGNVGIAQPPAHVLVDEYQDLNACDLAVIRRLTAAGAELFVAGDDDQSIYGFRYANPEGIRRFDQDYTPSASVSLEECQRCDSRILDVALYIARQDARRIEKRLYSAAGAGYGEVRILNFPNQYQEAECIARICAWLVNQRQIPPNEILILLRNDRNRLFSEPIRRALQNRGIPVATVADPLAPLNTGPGRGLLSLLRLLVNPLDHLALRTLLQFRANKVGETSLTALYELARTNGHTFGRALEAVKANPTVLGKYGRAVAQAAAEIDVMVNEIRQRPRANLAEFIAGVSHAYIPDAQPRSEFLAIFTRVLSVAPPDDLEDLLRTINVSLSDREDEGIEQETEAGAVNIMTMHQAKGLSAKAVFVAAVEDEYIPGRATGEGIGDERRLLYVSATRARSYLYFTHCTRRTGPQAHSGRTAGVERRNLTTFLSGGPIPSATGAQYIESIGA